MMQDWDYPRALRELWDRSSYERGLIGDPFGDVERARRGMARMRDLLAHLDNPHRATPTVHIAGSKGKGSTANFIASAARSAGLRVGIYTSPHLHRFPERIAVGGRPLPDSEFARIAEKVAVAASARDSAAPEMGTVTTFEFLTAMAFLAFASEQCDLAVIEVGLGGLYDATNVLTPVVSVITRIDLEHTAVLGPTYADIAFQKAGILQPGVPCVSSPQRPDAAEVIAAVAAERGAPLLIGGRHWSWEGSWDNFRTAGPWGDWAGLSLGIPGVHQIENACTALAALHDINAAGLVIPEDAARHGLAAAAWPGRFEQRHLAGREVVFDGAHTPAAAAALVATWRAMFGEQQATVIAGMGSDKNLAAFLEELQPIAATLIATRADSPRAATPDAIAATARHLGMPTIIEPTVAAAIARARETAPMPLLITGSLFVAGEGREAFGLAEPDHIWQAMNAAHRANATAP